MSIRIINPFKADEKLLKSFHSQEYVNNLMRLSNGEDEEKLTCEDEDDFGIGYDCPLIDNLFEYCCNIGGASLTAAHLINNSSFKYVVNWFGGWHHAKRFYKSVLNAIKNKLFDKCFFEEKKQVVIAILTI